MGYAYRRIRYDTCLWAMPSKPCRNPLAESNYELGCIVEHVIHVVCNYVFGVAPDKIGLSTHMCTCMTSRFNINCVFSIATSHHQQVRMTIDANNLASSSHTSMGQHANTCPTNLSGHYRLLVIPLVASDTCLTRIELIDCNPQEYM